jgi:hypothetical protein
MHPRIIEGTGERHNCERCLISHYLPAVCGKCFGSAARPRVAFVELCSGPEKRRAVQSFAKYKSPLDDNFAYICSDVSIEASQN